MRRAYPAHAIKFWARRHDVLAGTERGLSMVLFRGDTLLHVEKRHRRQHDHSAPPRPVHQFGIRCADPVRVALDDCLVDARRGAWTFRLSKRRFMLSRRRFMSACMPHMVSCMPAIVFCRVLSATVTSSRLGSPTNQLTHVINADSMSPGSVDSLQYASQTLHDMPTQPMTTAARLTRFLVGTFMAAIVDAMC